MGLDVRMFIITIDTIVRNVRLKIRQSCYAYCRNWENFVSPNNEILDKNVVELLPMSN